MADVRDRLTNLRIPNPAVIAEPPHFAQPVVAANAAVGGMSALNGNRIHLLEESDDAIDRLVDAIERATDHVHILFYIWLPDHSGQKMAHAVARAAQRGVECRVIVDALGSRLLVRSALWTQMQEAGSVEKRRGSLRGESQRDYDMDDFLAGTPFTPGAFTSGTGRLPDDTDVTTTEL